MENKKKVILDCDPGHDDAFGIMLAVQHLDVLGITTIGGNCTLENVTRNAIKVLEVLGVADRIGVYPGHSCPMVAPLVTAPQFHGETGLDGPVLPEPTHAAQNKHAVDFIVDTVMSTDDVTLIATGPLTNIASAINREPRIVERVKELCIMGGSVTYGNWTPAAEFNILVDPEAAKIVFTSGVPITMAGLDVTEKALILPEDFERVRALGNPVSDIVAQWLEFFYRFHRSIGYAGAPMHDPCAVMALIHPEIFTIRPMYVQIETAGEYCRGTTVGDLLGFSGHAPNADVLMDVDRDRFADLLVEAIKFYGEAEA